MSLDNYDRAIIHFLANNGESTTNRIAEELKIGWSTTKQHAFRLFQLRYLRRRIDGDTTYWDVVSNY